MHIGNLARVALAVSIVTLGALAPALTASATETHEIAATADAWVNAYRPGKNHGPDWRLKTYPGAYETYIRFDVSSWRGKSVGDLELRLADVSGDATTLSVEATGASWDELTLNYRNRPDSLSLGAVPATANPDGASFDLTQFFAAGTLDVDELSLRVVSSAAAVVGFGSRESASPPRLVLSSVTPVQPLPMPAIADVHASELTPTTNYAATQSLVVDASPETDTYIKFDLSGLIGQRVDGFKLGLWLKDEAGAGLAVHRVPSTWLDTELVWDNRPELGPLLATVDSRTPAGSTLIALGAVFSSGYVDKETLSLRISTSSPNGFVFSSSEGSTPPFLVVSAEDGTPTPTPTPVPTATPTPSPTPTPTATPTPTPTDEPTPTATPTPTPTDEPTPTATPTPSATPTPPAAERWYFRGFGTDHGVGLSQYGARGRANAGQTYDQILGHYYSDTTLGTIDPDQDVRVLLAYSHVPTATMPARVWARGGTWSSPTFTDGDAPVVFPAASYAEMVPSATGWVANVYDPAGVLLATMPTTDLMMSGTTDATLFQMRFRDSLFKYDLYRGAMRMLVNGAGIEAINTVGMDDYLKGVVPAEIPPLWAIESVKAQAVAARGYAYVRLKPNKVYDVQPTADNQVYGGYRLEHPRSNLAVDATSSQVVMADGEVANTYFFTTAGGYTESNEYAWVNNVGKIVSDPISYLRGVPDVDENGLAYDRAAPLYDWQSDSFTWAQLQGMLARDNRTDVGSLLELRFERGVSGRIYRVVVVGSRRTVYVSGQALKGIYNTQRLSGSSLRSSMFYLEPVPE